MIYYAVFKGTNRGIYESWAEAKNAIKGSSKPIYRKFEDYEQAIKFYENGPQSDDDGFMVCFLYKIIIYFECNIFERIQLFFKIKWR